MRIRPPPLERRSADLPLTTPGRLVGMVTDTDLLRHESGIRYLSGVSWTGPPAPRS
jgi:CBS domain-containing protein